MHIYIYIYTCMCVCLCVCVCVKEFKSQLAWAKFLFTPPAWMGVLCCVPCFINSNVEWTARAKHVALTHDGISAAHLDREKEMPNLGYMTQLSKSIKAVPYSLSICTACRLCFLPDFHWLSEPTNRKIAAAAATNMSSGSSTFFRSDNNGDDFDDGFHNRNRCGEFCNEFSTDFGKPVRLHTRTP